MAQNEVTPPEENDVTPPQDVDWIFRENSTEILAQMTAVIEGFGIQGYSVHAATVGIPPSPNPDICIPYVKHVPGDGWEAGCSYVSY